MQYLLDAAPVDARHRAALDALRTDTAIGQKVVAFNVWRPDRLRHQSRRDRPAVSGRPGLGGGGRRRRLRVAVALLCECAPYVDEPDSADIFDDLLEDACRHDSLARQRDGDRREIALRAPAPD